MRKKSAKRKQEPGHGRVRLLGGYKPKSVVWPLGEKRERRYRDFFLREVRGIPGA